MDVVLSICLQSDIPTAQTGNAKPGTVTKQLPSGAGPATSDLSGSTRSQPVPSASSYKPNRGKRKELDSMCFLLLRSYYPLLPFPTILCISMLGVRTCYLC